MVHKKRKRGKDMSILNLLKEPDAPVDLQTKRITECFKCPSMKTYRNGTKNSCGTFFIPNLLGENKTCGCDVDEKVKYLNEECPQGKW